MHEEMMLLRWCLDCDENLLTDAVRRLECCIQYCVLHAPV
jgi:hypothetical protein